MRDRKWRLAVAKTNFMLVLKRTPQSEGWLQEYCHFHSSRGSQRVVGRGQRGHLPFPFSPATTPSNKWRMIIHRIGGHNSFNWCPTVNNPGGVNGPLGSSPTCVVVLCHHTPTHHHHHHQYLRACGRAAVRWCEINQWNKQVLSPLYSVGHIMTRQG